ncbi:MAG: regulatory protein RecX [Candidatus Enterenecus sp.]
MRIEKLEPSQHRAGRWLVWFEDGSFLRVGEGDVVSLSLYAGKELNEQEAAALTAAAQQSKLNERAVELLSARAMSRKELVDKLSAPSRRRKKTELVQAEPDPEALAREREALRQGAEQAADRMEELGLLNDGEYAAAVVRHYVAKGFGERKIRDELYRRGVPRDCWEDALGEQPGPEDALDRLVRQKLRGAEPTRENLKKVSDYLARRGFGWEEISAALERYGAEMEE